jgi:hypothetical protein
MGEALHPSGRSRSLAQRIAVALTVTAAGLAVLFGLLGAEWRDEAREADAAARERQLAQSLADRGGVHLAAGDLLRLSTVAAVVRDAADGRVLVLDAEGKVVIDTSLVLGEQRLGLLAVDGPLQRMLTSANEPVLRETAAPIRRVGETLGEVRVHCPLPERHGGFDFAAAGLALLIGLAFVVGAVVCACHWSTRVRTTTGALLRLAASSANCRRRCASWSAAWPTACSASAKATSPWRCGWSTASSAACWPCPVTASARRASRSRSAAASACPRTICAISISPAASSTSARR